MQATDGGKRGFVGVLEKIDLLYMRKLRTQKNASMDV
jgi:hypothetical protein